MIKYLKIRALHYILLSTLIILSACTKYTTMVHAASPTATIDLRGHPSPALNNLLALFNIQHDGSLPSIVAETQKAWLRPVGTERWEVIDALPHSVVQQIKPLLEELSLTKEIKPKKGEYKYALLLGSRLSFFLERLAYLIHQWQQGIRFQELVVLTGQRDLTKEETLGVVLESSTIHIIDPEKLKKEWESVKTEKEMMEKVLIFCWIPETMRNQVTITIIDAPKIPKADGALVRPTTGDTINKWLERHPSPGSCVAVSNQPHIGYQQAVLETLLSPDFSVETIGTADRDQTKIAEKLDALARFLYQENIRRQKQR